jgi:hypothetical protein
MIKEIILPGPQAFGKMEGILINLSLAFKGHVLTGKVKVTE